jgi:hypothetical protein
MRHAALAVILVVGLTGAGAERASAGLVEAFTYALDPQISADGHRVWVYTDIFDLVGASRVEIDIDAGTETPAPFPSSARTTSGTCRW